MNTTSQWDVVCIGAGITSLAFAAQLVKRNPGLRVLVIEKHLVPGGYASIFRRPKQDALFDCSLHKLTGMTGNGNLKRIFDDMDLSSELEFIYPDHYFQLSLADQTIPLPNDPAKLKEKLLSLYPEDTDGIHQFFSDVEVHGKNAYFQFQIMAGTYDVPITELIASLRFAHKNLKTITVKEALQKLFSSPVLRELLSMPGGYAGGHPEDLGYLYYLHIIYASLYRGNAYVAGASQRISDALVAKIEKSGGQVLLRTRAEQILVDEKNRVTGVRTSRGIFHTRQVYINASPHYAVNALFDQNVPLDAVKKSSRD